jgi:hypothetical protein
MIGQAVFLVASDMSREVGSMWKVLVVWTVGGIIVPSELFAMPNWGLPCPRRAVTTFT